MDRSETPSPFGLKMIFTRFCFFLGLGTATYCSYAQVTTWMNPASAPASPASLPTAPALLPPAAAFSPPVWTSRSETGTLPPVVHSEGLALASPSPAGTPSASPTPEAQASVEGQAPADSGAPLATVEPLPAILNPEAWMAMAAQQGLRAPAQEYGRRDEAAPVPTPVQAQGMFLPSPEAAAANTGSGNSSGSAGTSPSLGGTGISSAGASVLTSQDLAALAVPLNGLLSDQEVVVSGLFCGNGLQGRGCNPESRMGVHTSRYGLNEGLHEQASVSFSGSNVGALELSLTLRIQDTEGKDSTLSGSVRAIEVRVKTEAREGRNLRVVEVKTGDFEVRPGDRLRKVHARIVWDVSNADEPVLLPESSVSFARKSVATSTLPWNFAAPSAVGPTDPAIIADEIGYSMSIEKAR